MSKLSFELTNPVKAFMFSTLGSAISPLPIANFENDIVFDCNVLAAKITAILRRSYDFVSNHNILEYQGVRFNLDDNTVSFQSSQMELSKNEAKILRLLMEKKGTIVSRDRLMEYLWKTDFYVDENALSVNVNRLRK